jgi:hypothetical protein
MKHKGSLTRVYLFVLFVLLPLDWFTPTGKLLREFGAKPAAPLLVLGSLFIFLFRSDSIRSLSRSTYRVSLCLACIFLLGTFGFWLNLIFDWSGQGRSKTPIFQFSTQAALFVAFSVAVIAHSQLFTKAQWRTFTLSILPLVILIHLAVFFLDATGIVSHAQGWLALFRNGAGLNFDRPSGLMSEPSYFGAFAAMYGLPLLTIRSPSKRATRWVLASLVFTMAIIIRAKTFVPVIGLECIMLMWVRGRPAIRLKYVCLGALFLTAALYMIISNATFDMQENLSSAMRLGSTELAFNVADHGYGLTGIGFGQFHFFYRAQYAPHFLFVSQEAQDQMTGSAESRASTYNLYVRLLVETGILGLTCFLALIYRSLRDIRSDYRPTTLFGVLLTAGSLGFLLTQDTYFYPPLAVGLAWLLGCATDWSSEIHPNESQVHN